MVALDLFTLKKFEFLRIVLHGNMLNVTQKHREEVLLDYNGKDKNYKQLEQWKLTPWKVNAIKHQQKWKLWILGIFHEKKVQLDTPQVSVLSKKKKVGK